MLFHCLDSDSILYGFSGYVKSAVIVRYYWISKNWVENGISFSPPFMFVKNVSEVEIKKRQKLTATSTFEE